LADPGSFHTLVTIWLSANLLNTLTAATGLAQGFVEVSPVPKWALQHGGPVAMWGLKATGVMLLPMLLWRGHQRGFFSSLGIRFGLVLALMLVIAVVLWEIAWLLGWLPL
jgi:hypothetical protein